VGKTRLLNFARYKDSLLTFLATFVALLGIPSALLQMVGTHFSIRSTSLLVILSFSAAVLVTKRPWRKRNVPVEGLLFDNDDLRDRRRLRCPADLKILEEVAQLARQCYGKSTISLSSYVEIWKENPNILVALTGAKGEFLGYFDVIPLKCSFGEFFLAGRVSEKDITKEDVVKPTEIAECKYIYISGLAVANWETYQGQTNANILVWGLLKYLGHFYGRQNSFAFAVAVTKDGEKLLRSFHLELLSEGSCRRDKCSIYGLTLTRSAIRERLACVLDFSLLCTIDWSIKNDEKPLSSSPKRPALPQKRRRTLSA